MKPTLACLALFVLTISPAEARARTPQPPAQSPGPQPVDPRALPGVWKPLVDVTGSPSLTSGRRAAPAQAGALKQQLIALIDIARQMPIFAQPRGMIAEPSVHIGNDGGWRGSRAWPLGGYANVELYEYYTDPSTGKVRTDRSGAEFGWRLYVNDLQCAFTRAPMYRDAIGPIFDRPPELTMNQGFPHAGNCTLLTRSAEPIFVPVTRERVLRLYIALVDSSLKDLVEMQPHLTGSGRHNVDSTIAAGRARQERYRRWLATWAPEQRNAPAVLDLSGGENPFAEHPESGLVARLVEPNQRLFDLTRLTDAQLIAVADFDVRPWATLLLPQIDWQALRARLK